MIKKQCLSLFCAICLFVLLFSLSGCGRNTKPAKTNDVDFTVVSAGDVPEELNKLIKERKKNPFELTFSDNASLYIVKGYGKQPTGGYSITVNDFINPMMILFLIRNFLVRKRMIHSQHCLPTLILLSKQNSVKILLFSAKAV